MESRVDQSSLASTSTSVPPQETGSDLASLPPTTSKPSRTKKTKPRIVLQGTADEILDRNAARSASPAFVEKLVARAGTHWNKFYSNHARNPATNQFFKDRHWTDREWPQLAQLAEPGPVGPQGKGKAVLEVGCGTGAFIYPYSLLPLLKSRTEEILMLSMVQVARTVSASSLRRVRLCEKVICHLFPSSPAVYFCSPECHPSTSFRAVELTKVGGVLIIRPKTRKLRCSSQREWLTNPSPLTLRRVPPQNHPLYTPSSCHIFQHDLTLPLSSLSEKLASPPPEFGDPILPGSFDIVSCVFVLSALPPHKQAEAIKTLISVRPF